MLCIGVNIKDQTLSVNDSVNGVRIKSYLVSTSKYGVGQEMGSYKTPIGKHYIRAKIGDGAPSNAVFVSRRRTGEIFNSDLREQFPQRDWILTRIMWLSGCELGVNRLGQVDTMRRFIYIHGAPDDVEMGIPGSIGCIRMRNVDLVELFDLVDVGTSVNIDNGEG
ncbi:MAG: L,D-transpeptidase family protein [Burkholderiales bacterium]|jgi:L,D-transpeptidase YbiS